MKIFPPIVPNLQLNPFFVLWGNLSFKWKMGSNSTD